MIIRIVAAGLVFLLVIFSSLNNGSAKTSNSPTPLPIATPNLVVNVAETAVVPQTGFSTRTVEATPAAMVTVTRTIESVPAIGKEEIKSVVPNPPTSLRSGSELNEVSGAHLTIYNCVGSTGYVYCPGGSHTSSWTEVGPGTAACNDPYLGRKFQIVWDKQGLVWTCLDTGYLSVNGFDLWFYNLADGLTYIDNLPFPYQVTFVD